MHSPGTAPIWVRGGSEFLDFPTPYSGYSTLSGILTPPLGSDAGSAKPELVSRTVPPGEG